MTDPAARVPRSWLHGAGRWHPWLTLALAGGIVITVVDGLLLQRKLGFFTGGFLAADQLTGTWDRARFLAVSTAADTAMLAVPAWIACRINAALRLGRVAGWVLSILLMLAPVALFDLITYEIARFVGDAVNVTLLMDVGQNRPELVGVAWAYLRSPLALGVIGVTGIALAIVLIQRVLPKPPQEWRVPRAAFVRAAIVSLAGLVACGVTPVAYPWYTLALNWKLSGHLSKRLVRGATDFDADGYGLLDRPADPALFEFSIHPYAVDIPGNGVDENGIGGDLPLGRGPYREGPPAPPSAWTRKPNVVLILLESVRADVVGAMENGRAVTPVLNGLATRGFSATQAYSHNGFTAQSRYHLFTGSMANIRGATSLVDDFKGNGYQVAYFSGQDESFGGPAMMVGAKRSDVFFDAAMARDERYTRFQTPASLAVPYQVVENRVNAFLASRTDDRPLFLYVNLHDTHYPYWHKRMAPLLNHTVVTDDAIRPGKEAEVRAMYLNSVANVDASIGRLLESITSHLKSPPGVIVTSDHGESLLDDGFLGHGYSMNDAQTRVPFIVTGLDLPLEEPFGQVHLRDALWHALGTPSHDLRPTPTVFQYVGSLERPRQIAMRSGAGQIIVDLRAGRVRINDGAWRPEASLRSDEVDGLHALVWFWEGMLLAQPAVEGR
jgi:hypothetical protein